MNDPCGGLVEEDIIVANLVGGGDEVWVGVTEEIGLRWRGQEATAAIVFGFCETSADNSPPSEPGWW